MLGELAPPEHAHWFGTRDFELDFFMRKRYLTWLPVVSLPWCVVCFRTVPVHPWPGPQPEPPCSSADVPVCVPSGSSFRVPGGLGLCISVWSLGSTC